jgi:DNA polymerase-1
MRHFTVNPTVSDNGDHVGGVVGFLKGLQLLIENNIPENIFVIWEGGGSTRRRAIFPEYKHRKRPVRLNRFYEEDLPATVENRNYQVNLLVKLLRNSGVRQIYVSDCEADDVIGYLAKYFFKNKKLIIVSSDKDYYQLISDRVSVWSPGQKKFITSKIVKEKFNIPVHNFCLARCFCGDGSDGLPGIKGAGFPTMVKRFPELSGPASLSVEDIINLSVERATKSKIKLFKEINSNASLIKRNWKLMYLDLTNMSGTQILKIEHLTNTLESKPNKINFLRTLMRNGVNNFDADKYFKATRLLNK